MIWYDVASQGTDELMNFVGHQDLMSETTGNISK